MTSLNINELPKPRASVDQITLARELCNGSDPLNTLFNKFLDGRPNSEQMEAFIHDLKTTGLKNDLKKMMDANIAQICETVGIENPTGSDRLLALQIGLLQEQNAALRRLTDTTDRVAMHTNRQESIFGPVLAAILIGKIL